MRRIVLCSFASLMTLGIYAQKKDFNYKFYGQIRTDLFYNSRANEETVDGLFYMYPKDIKEDADGKDLNATPNGSFYVLYTRLGVDMAGPVLGKAKTSAKIEVDFRGSGNSFSMIRVRQAYVSLDWLKSALLLGQTWHPLYGDVAPQILNLAAGAPFQPFSRAPMIRFQYNLSDIRFTGAAIWQSQYLSAGPAGKNQNYIKNSCVPEFYVGVDYKKNRWLAGAGIELLSLKPRTESTVDGKTYKVNERLTSLSYEAHIKYTNRDWMVAAKTLLASNLTQTSMLGGYGITKIDRRTGEQEYAPMRHSSSWLNVVYGRKWKPGVFVGYVKNLGTKDALVSETLYGTGTNVDQLATGGAELTYNLSHWKFGAEYMLSSVWYGSLDKANGKITDTHAIRNNRIVVSALYLF